MLGEISPSLRSVAVAIQDNSVPVIMLSAGEISIVSTLGRVFMTVIVEELLAFASLGSVTVALQVNSSLGETVSGESTSSAFAPSS